MGTHIPANIKALAVGIIVSDLPRSRQQAWPSVGAHMFFGNFPVALQAALWRPSPGRRMLPLLVVSSSWSLSSPDFAPFHSFPFALHFLLFLQHSRQITATAPTFNAPNLFIIFFGPLWHRCKPCRMISCFLSRNISTSQTSMLFK